MATDYVQIAIYGISILVIAAVIAHFFATISGTSLFNLLSALSKQDTKKTFKFKKFPDDRKFVLSYPTKNFKATINGITIAGNDPRTGRQMIRFNYGEDLLTDFSVPADPSYFRIADPTKLSDISKIVIEIVDDDAYWKLKQKADNLQLYSKTLEKSIQDMMENQNAQLLKQIEHIKEKKRVAFGWTGSAPQPLGFVNRPWGSFSRFGVGTYGIQQSEEEQF